MKKLYVELVPKLAVSRSGPCRDCVDRLRLRRMICMLVVTNRFMYQPVKTFETSVYIVLPRDKLKAKPIAEHCKLHMHTLAKNK